MKLQKFGVNNWCQFKERTFHYQPGVTVVTAPNGSGKTNFFDVGQFFAWTGTIPGSTSKQDVLRWGEKSGGVFVEFEEEGIPYRIDWAIPKSKVLMAWKDKDGLHEVKKAGEVTEKLETMLGMPVRMFRELSFIGQGKFMQVVTDRAARIEYFNRITDTKRLADIRTLFVKLRSQLPQYADVRPDIKHEEMKKEELEEKVKNKQKELEPVLKEAKEAEETRKQAEKVLEKPSSHTKQQEFETARLKLEKLKESEPRVLDEPEAPGLSLDSVMFMSSKITEKSRYEEQIEILRKELKDLEQSQPEEPEDNRLEVEEAEMEQGLEHAAVLSERLGKCVLCKHELSGDFSAKDFQESAEKARAIIKTREKQEQDLKVFQNTVQNKQQQLQTAETALKEILENLPEGWENVDIEQEKKTAEEYQKKYKAFQVALQEHSKWENSLQRQENLAQHIEETLKTCAGEEEINRAREDKEKAERVLARYEEVKKEMEDLEAEVKVSDGYLKKLYSSEKLRLSAEKDQEVVGKCVNVLHPQRLPKTLMNPLLRPYNAYLTHYLNQFSVDYTCRMNTEFAFEFDRGQGWKDADRMSGGQKVNLALCNYLASMNVVMPKCPLLVMDEPTDSLDADRKAGLISTLKELGASSKGMYIIIITHDEEVMEAADHVVHLESDISV